jgi:parvulin-like peptidyl-prolyl isomerase
MLRFFREPFVHFVVLGAALFGGHALWQKHVSKADRTIYVSPAEMERQAQIFASENQRLPSDADLEGLLFAHVEEQILMREAQRLGLDADDTIIRRRLAQKMRFMISDISAPSLPDRADLQIWYNDNPAAFMRPETRSFEHIFLSPKGRAETVEAEAAALLASGPAQDWKSLGDAFMTGRSFTRLAEPAVRRDFGTAFAKRLFGLADTPDWQGPVNSAFGVHLVRMTDITPAFLPAFEDIQLEVETVWLDEAKRAENAEALKALIETYKVEVAE